MKLVTQLISSHLLFETVNWDCERSNKNRHFDKMIFRSARNRGNKNSKKSMTYDHYREDMVNTGVVAALLGGFSLTNSWEMEMSGSILDTVTYVIAIICVHVCTCSALTSAFLYRSLTISDPKEAVRWMDSHPTIASLPYFKFVAGVITYMASVILVAWKQLEDVPKAKQFTFFSGLCAVSSTFYVLVYLYFDSPAHRKPSETEEDSTKSMEQHSEG